jgi:hypothetical protein
VVESSAWEAGREDGVVPVVREMDSVKLVGGRGKM